ncbi:MAG: hypothetical protein H6810_11715 [Phycisphaeraceae bacterium]|nr:MAG: hypothetical protein H6810_11715 [Phycisphaeraceae bacterium]
MNRMIARMGFAVAALAMFAASHADAQMHAIWKFQNNTGRVANDLHATFVWGNARSGFQGGLPAQQSRTFGSADRFTGTTDVHWDAEAGQSVDNGDWDRVELTFRQGSRITSATANWTFDGANIGAVNKAVRLAMQSENDGTYTAVVVNDTGGSISYDGFSLAQDIDMSLFSTSSFLDFAGYGQSIATGYDGSGVFAVGETEVASGLTIGAFGYTAFSFQSGGDTLGAAVVPSPAAGTLLGLGGLTAARRRR